MGIARKRRYIYDETYDKVMKFAWRKFELEGTRDSSGKPLYQNFAFSLKVYLESTRKEQEYIVGVDYGKEKDRGC